MQERTRSRTAARARHVEILEAVAPGELRPRRGRGRARGRACCCPAARRWASRSWACSGRRACRRAGAAPAPGGHPLHRRRAVPSPTRPRDGPHRRHQRPRARAGGDARGRSARRCWASPGTRWRTCPRRSGARRQGFDVVLTSAGVSVGERDFVKDALEEPGRGAGLLARGHQARQAAGRGPARRDRSSSACPATRPPRWSPSSCSSAPRCAGCCGHPDVEPAPRARPRRRPLTQGRGAGPLRPGDRAWRDGRAVGPPARHPDVGSPALGRVGHPPAALPPGSQSWLWGRMSSSCRSPGRLSNDSGSRIDPAPQRLRALA